MFFQKSDTGFPMIKNLLQSLKTAIYIVPKDEDLMKFLSFIQVWFNITTVTHSGKSGKAYEMSPFLKKFHQVF